MRVLCFDPAGGQTYSSSYLSFPIADGVDQIHRVNFADNCTSYLDGDFDREVSHVRLDIPQKGTGDPTNLVVDVDWIAFTDDANFLPGGEEEGEGEGEGEGELHPADVDGNGYVDAIDVQLVINCALGIDVGFIDCDINGDETVNAEDIQLVINAALGVW